MSWKDQELTKNVSQNWFWYQLQRKTKTREIFCCDSWGLDIVGQPSTRTRILSAEHGSSQSTIDRQLNKLGLVNRHCPKVPYELTNDQAHLRVNIYKLLANFQDDRFRRHIFTGVKNGSIFVNLTKEISGFAPSRLQNLLSNNDGLNRSVWWNFSGGVSLWACPTWSCGEFWALYPTTSAILCFALKARYPKLDHESHPLMQHINTPQQTLSMSLSANVKKKWRVESSASNRLQFKLCTISCADEGSTI